MPASTRAKLSLVPVLLLLACLLPGLAAACGQLGAYIVNISQDETDQLNPTICTNRSTDEQIRACLATQLNANLDGDCKSHFDIFVPGTAAEHGAWKQFNHMFNTNNNRAHLSLQYNDDRDAGLFFNFDPAFYDQGVIDARVSLILLLDTLVEHFQPEQIRVFGHSKGSHSVALVADEPRFSGIEFFAFAQPGRTSVDIDSAAEIKAGKRGDPGYIHKLSPNLVGITWRNDEVVDYTGSGTNGLQVPEKWEFPGFIWQTGGGGSASEMFIDHHNNYGGRYTDGIAGNDWRAGEGGTADAWPYCATGDKIAWDDPECSKQNVEFVPWFWGSPACQVEAFQMMAGGNVGDQYYIGYSGPRQPGNCRYTKRTTRAYYQLRYYFDLPDKDCVYNLKIDFVNFFTSKIEDSIQVSGTTANDQTWRTATGYIYTPYHIILKLRAWLVEDSQGGWLPSCDTFTESEIFVEYLRLYFTHPGTGEGEGEDFIDKDRRTIIGFREGRGSDVFLNDLHKWDNVAWEQPNQSNEEIKMYYSSLKDSLKIEGPTQEGNQGRFEKKVHLLD